MSDILIKNIGNLSKECNECLRTYIAMNDGDENLINSFRVDCKAGLADCPLVEVKEAEVGDLYEVTKTYVKAYMTGKKVWMEANE